MYFVYVVDLLRNWKLYNNLTILYFSTSKMKKKLEITIFFFINYKYIIAFRNF